MWTPKTKISYLLYQGTAAWLPISQRTKLAKRIRGGWVKRIISHCGEIINIEKHTTFMPELRMGDNFGVGINCEVYGPVTIGKLNTIYIKTEIVENKRAFCINKQTNIYQ